jgi:DNA-binding NtrC family response regulator
MATVLYVDDQEAIRRAVKLWLSRKGHVVLLADTAAAARALVSGERIDGIFIDLRLGADSGLELYEWIDSLDSDLSQRVAFVTGDLSDEGLHSGRLQCPVLAKPFELHELEVLANRWHAERAASREKVSGAADDSRARPGQ